MPWCSLITGSGPASEIATLQGKTGVMDMSQLLELRAEKDSFLAKNHHSPLTLEQKREFKGLNYFPENLDLRLDVDVDVFSKQEDVQIQTSTGDLQDYKKFGRFQFSVDGQAAELTIFVSEHGYFLPFVDSLAGEDTYPAGRYLEIEPTNNGNFLVDFNQAYNPFCAYNDAWSCPLTPFENRLKVPIRAGEKVFM